MRNEEQRLRDNQGGSELTNRPDDHPVGAAGETVSAEAEGPPPDRVSNIGAPVRSAGPEETTLPDGVAFVINKPVDVEALLAVIRHHCG